MFSFVISLICINFYICNAVTAVYLLIRRLNEISHLQQSLLLLLLLLIRRRHQKSIDRKGILKQSDSEEAPNRQEVMGPVTIQVSSAILQD